MTWRDAMLSTQLARQVIESIDRCPLILNLRGIEVTSAFWQHEGNLLSRPVVLIMCAMTPDGRMPAINVEMDGWAMSVPAIDAQIWPVLEKLADSV